MPEVSPVKRINDHSKFSGQRGKKASVPDQDTLTIEELENKATKQDQTTKPKRSRKQTKKGKRDKSAKRELATPMDSLRERQV